jgi:1-acyl-sn-glycerol-3-phosphate acyltransferase
VRSLIALWRIAATVALIVDGLRQAAFVLPRQDAAGRRARVQAWSRKVLARLGVELRIDGAPQAGGVLIVANHVSWLDITALHAVAPQLRFVSKSAIAHWPLLGALARAARTLFIEREKKRDALRVVHEVASALKDGDTVCVFPEGTTGPGDTVLPFHANLLQAAIATGVPVQPVALRYSEPGLPVSVAAQYIGETTLVGSLLKVAGGRGLVVHVAFLEAEPPGETERRRLAQALQARIAARLAADLAAPA